MAIFSQNQVRDVMINNYTGTTAGSFDVVVTDNEGGAVGSGDALLFKQLLSNGNYRPGPIIKKDEVKYVSKVTSKVPVPKFAYFTTTPTAAGDEHQAIITEK